MELNYKELNHVMHQYLDENDIEEVYAAYKYARTAHSGQFRKSGEPFIIHPVAVSIVLAEQKLPKKVLICALLHDVIEDTSVTYEDIANNFGQDVADIVEGVTKLGNIHGLTNDQVQAANHHKIILAAAKDIRVILVKLADRVHNMRTIKHMRDESKKKIATETLEIYAPLAHRFGMYRIKWELEDLSFKCINRKAYDDIAEKLQMRRSERDNIVNKITVDAMKLINENGVEARIYGRSKSIYSIYQKLKKSGKDFDDLTDLFAFRIIVKTIPECYQVLGIIHENYKPIPMRFKDYIPTPKHNMYQSIHTTVLTMWGVPIEFQIRTESMDQTAEYGIASHWMYKSDKESETLQNLAKSRVDLLRRATESGNGLDAKEFMDAIKLDYFSKNLIVYTPKGDVVEVPEDSCVLDFAYYIHTNIGHKAVSAKVNDKVVSVFHRLQIGDVVQVITSDIAEPSVSSIQMVKTSRAKEAIQKYFKNLKKNNFRKEGKRILDQMAREEGINDFDEYITENNIKQKLGHRFNVDTSEDFYYEVGVGSINLKEVFEFAHDNEKSNSSLTNKDVIVEGESQYTHKLCTLCSPIPGDDIYAIEGKKYTMNKHYIIHRHGCIDSEHTLSAEWNQKLDDVYVARFNFEIIDEKGSMAKVLKLLSEMDKNMTSVYLRAGIAAEAVGRISVELRNYKEYQDVRSNLMQLDNVKKVTRVIGKDEDENY